MLLVMVVVAVAGAFGITSATDSAVADVDRIEGLEGLLLGGTDDQGNPLPEGVDLPTQNYLLVGSDTREGISSDDPDFGVIGDTNIVGGRRADTIMVLRRETDGGAALISLPRDLWV